MKLRYLWPKGFQNKVVSLSHGAQVRLSWMDWYLSHGKNARATCRHFGISPDTFYLWKKRFNPGSLITLEDNKNTRRPKHLREMTTSLANIQKVIQIRKNDPEKSKYEIAQELKREGIKLGTSTIQKVINRHKSLLFNSLHSRKLKVHRKMAIARIKAARELKEKEPGSLVQIDTKHLYILHKRFYVFAAIDSFSRLGYISAFGTGSSLSGSLFLEEVLNYFPFKIEAIQTDNGSEYLLSFHKGSVRKILSCTILPIRIAPDKMAEPKDLFRPPPMSFSTGRMTCSLKSTSLKKNAKNLMRNTITTGFTSLWGTIPPENI